MISILVLSSLMMQRPNTASLIELSWNETRVIGHRGAAAYKPENTLEAFEEGIQCKADAVECDVHMSKDGEPVIMHDATLDRTTTLKGAVKNTLWDDMRKAGVPSLADLTKVTKDRVVLVVEIKAGDKVDEKVVSHLQKEKMMEQSIIFSFGAEHVAECKRLDSSIYSVWLVGKTIKEPDYPAIFSEWKRTDADGIGLAYSQVTPEFVKMAHSKKIPVFVWTVPPGAEIDRLKALKVNFIITNHPRDVRQQLGIQ